MNRLLKAMVMAGITMSLGFTGMSQASVGPQETPAATRSVGTIKNIAGNNLTLTADAGPEVDVLVLVTTRIVRVAPGQKDLKDAAPVLFKELQAGDRVLVRGTPSPDGKALTASLVVLMKNVDVAQKKERDLEDWNKRGVGGLVTAVDPATGIVKLTSGTKPFTIYVAKETVIRRYSPGSVKFEDAAPAKLEEIKVGDQLRARGNHNGDNSEIHAEEVVGGTFQNVAGLIKDIDPAAQTITVNDLATKKPLTIKITPDSQMHKLPEMAAQMLAMRLRAMRGEASGDTGRPPGFRPPEGGRSQQGGASQFGGRMPRNGGGDLNQILSRAPQATFAELKKGDAVMIVTTQAKNSPLLNALTLLTGVEPILTSPEAAMLLSPWNMGGGEGGPQ